MAKTTTNLGLYEKESTDSQDTFNIQQMLNDNWDKIDNLVAKKTEIPTIPSSLPANGGNSTTVNNHTAAATSSLTEKIDLIGMANENKNSLDSHKADYMYQIANIVGTQIKINRLSNTNRLFFKLDDDLTGGAITISTDGGATEKPLQDTDGNAVTILEKGFVEVIADATFFTLRNRGISSSQKQSLIDITNAAEANERTIKTNIANALNNVSVLQSLGLNSSSSWMDILNAISNVKTGKNFKIGTVTGGSSQTFTYANNSGSGNFTSVTVTGLTFKPTIIILIHPGTSIIIYSEINDGFYSKTAKMVGFNGNYMTASNYNLKGDVTPASVTSSGFTLPVLGPESYTWIAIE